MKLEMGSFGWANVDICIEAKIKEFALENVTWIKSIIIGNGVGYGSKKDIILEAC